jgi:hypothetical protein
VLNGSKKVIDGIVETHMYFADRERIAKETYAEMELALHQSTQKKKAKEIYQPKTPSVLTLNLEDDPPLASDRSHKERMIAWHEGLDNLEPDNLMGGPGFPLETPDPKKRKPTPTAPPLEVPTAPPSTKTDIWSNYRSWELYPQTPNFRRMKT